MDNDKIIASGITFDDVLMIPAKSDFVPSQADTSTNLTNNIRINIPLVSAAMDTVTESALAIALAQEGGIGIIHKNLSMQDQQREVAEVKRSENGVILDPVTLTPDDTVSSARELMQVQNVSGIPILKGKKLVGILTRRDLKFLKDISVKIDTVMTVIISRKKCVVIYVHISRCICIYTILVISIDSIGTYEYILNTTGGSNYSANSSMDNQTFIVSQNTTLVLLVLFQNMHLRLEHQQPSSLK